MPTFSTIQYLRSDIFKSSFDLPVEILDAYSKYTVHNQQKEYPDRLMRVKNLLNQT